MQSSDLNIRLMFSVLRIPYITLCHNHNGDGLYCISTLHPCLLYDHASVNMACVTHAFLLATYFVGNLLTFHKRELSHFSVTNSQSMSHWQCKLLELYLSPCNSSTIKRIPLQTQCSVRRKPEK